MCLHTAVTECVGYRTGIAGVGEDGYSGRYMQTHAGSVSHREDLLEIQMLSLEL